METADLPVTCVDLKDKDWEKTVGGGDAAFWASVEGDLAQRSAVLAARLARSTLKAQRPLRLHMPRRGSLTNLRPVPQTPSCGKGPSGLLRVCFGSACLFVDLQLQLQLGLRTKRPVVNDGEVEVRVEAIGLNFRDVLNAARPQEHLQLHTDIHIHTCACTCIYIYMYTYIHICIYE